MALKLAVVDGTSSSEKLQLPKIKVPQYRLQYTIVLIIGTP